MGKSLAIPLAMRGARRDGVQSGIIADAGPGGARLRAVAGGCGDRLPLHDGRGRAARARGSQTTTSCSRRAEERKNVPRPSGVEREGWW